MSGVTNRDVPPCAHRRLLQGGCTTSGFICATCGAHVATNYNPIDTYVIGRLPEVPSPVMQPKGKWAPPPGALHRRGRHGR